MLLYLGDILFLAVKTWPNNFFKNDMVYVAYQLIDTEHILEVLTMWRTLWMTVQTSTSVLISSVNMHKMLQCTCPIRSHGR